MIPLRLKLKNSIGIFEGINKREIEIDFTKFNRGVVGIFGHTGSGKSTIMENLHPFRKLMTRQGGLHEHFMDNGVREFEFDMDGHIYLSRLLIDAKKKKTVAQFYRDGDLLNDKLDEYDAHVNDLMGDYNLFVNSVFAPQTTEMILTLKDTPLKGLFMMLFNLEKYSQIYLPLLKLRRNDSEKRLEGVRGSYEVLEDNVREMEAVALNIEEEKAKIPVYKERAVAGDAAMKAHQQKIVDARQAYTKEKMGSEALQDKRDQLKVVQNDIENISRDIANEAKEIEVSLKSNQSEMDVAIYDKDSMDREIQRAEKIIGNKELILEKSQALVDLRSELEGLSGAEQQLLLKQSAINDLEKDMKMLKKNIDILEEVPCIGLDIYKDCKLLQNAFDSKDTMESKSQTIKKNLVDMAGLESDKKSAIEIRENVRLLEQDKWGEIKTELVIAEKNVSGWKKRRETSVIRIEECKKIYDSLQKKLDGLEEKASNRTAAKKEKRSKLQVEIKEMESSSDLEGLAGEISRLENITYKVENEYNEAKTNLVAAETRISEGEKAIVMLPEKKAAYESRRGQADEFMTDIHEWNILERFFKEAPVLELESLAQVTTEYANELISLYDESFSMQVITVLPKATKGVKEVFKIMVYKNGREVLAQNLSGGQQQIFDTVLRMAIVLTLSNTHDKKFLSSFFDESASAIDSEYAIKYIEMHERALSLSGKKFTFVISHHEKTQGMIDQKILVEEL